MALRVTRFSSKQIAPQRSVTERNPRGFAPRLRRANFGDHGDELPGDPCIRAGQKLQAHCKGTFWKSLTIDNSCASPKFTQRRFDKHTSILLPRANRSDARTVSVTFSVDAHSATTGFVPLESRTTNFLGLRFSLRPLSMISAYFRGLGHDLQAASQGAGRGELLGFQGVSEAYRGRFTPWRTHSWPKVRVMPWVKCAIGERPAFRLG